MIDPPCRPLEPSGTPDGGIIALALADATAGLLGVLALLLAGSSRRPARS